MFRFSITATLRDSSSGILPRKDSVPMAQYVKPAYAQSVNGFEEYRPCSRRRTVSFTKWRLSKPAFIRLWLCKFKQGALLDGDIDIPGKTQHT